MPTITLDDTNRLTIPAEILDRLGLRPGDRLNVESDNDGRLLLTPLPGAPALAAASTLQQTISSRNLETPIRFIKGVGPKLAETLAKKGVSLVEDALFLLPHRYEDRRALSKVSKLRPGVSEVFFAEVLAADAQATRGGKRFFEATVGDGSGTVTLKWFRFNPAFMKKIWKPGRKGIFTGEVVQYGFQREVHHPEVEWVEAGDDLEAVMARDPLNFGRILPVYSLTEGLSQKTMRKVLKEVVDGFCADVTNHLPAAVIDRHDLMPLDRALRTAHFPDNEADLETLNSGATAAHKTLAFDEFFFLELGLALKKYGIALEEGIAFQVSHRYTKELLKLLPFSRGRISIRSKNFAPVWMSSSQLVGLSARALNNDTLLI